MEPLKVNGDEYYIRGQAFHLFISEVMEIVSRSASPGAAVAGLRAPFARLLSDLEWLPEEFRRPGHQSGMGGGIGQWLLFRSGDRAVTVFSLVVPPGSATPVHDHLAWGLVGLYEGTQEERVYRLVRSAGESHAELELSKVRHLNTGDFYDLIPPEDDIHRVMTSSSIPSISIHLLARDVGCIWRHQYDPERSTMQTWRSGYTNAPCENGEKLEPTKS